MLHINSHSILYEPEDSSSPLIKLKFDENFTFKSYSFEELVNLYTELFNKESDMYTIRETINNNLGSSYKNKKSIKMIHSAKEKEKEKDMITTSFVNNTNRESVLTYIRENKEIKENNTPKESANQYAKKAKNAVYSQSLPIYQSQNTFIKAPSKPALLKITDLDQIFNNVFSNINILNNMNLNTNYIPTQHNNNLNTHNYSSHLENSFINQAFPALTKYRKPGNLMHPHHKNDSFNLNQFQELTNYFTENNLNLLSFSEIFYNMEKSFSIGDRESRYSYSILILKTNWYRKINRDFIDKYEEINFNRSYLFILEGKVDEIKKLFDDIFVFTEGLRNHDELTLVGMVTTRKLDELKEKYEDINLDEELFGEGNKISHPVSEGNHINIQINTQASQNIPSPTLKKKIIYQSNVTRILPEKFQNGLLIIHYSDSIKKNIKTVNVNLIANNPAQNMNSTMILKSILTRKNSLTNTVLLTEESNQNNNINSNIKTQNQAPIIENPYDFSNTILEFIPVNNNPKQKTIKFAMKDVKALVKYRFLYQYKAINIYLYSKKRSLIIDFENELECKIILDFMNENCPRLDKNFNDLKYHTNLWVDGLISNYDYLMYLNIQGGRSFNDLSQYPIMPWVLTNYDDEEILDLNDSKNFRDLSKPIGALNQKRLMYLKDNYNELKEQGKEFPYLYGTYYSFPYIIFYYLIRTHPIYYLRFQGGNFGPTDRLFFSIHNSWNSSFKNSNSQDVKELIPEFYNSDGDFLKNIHGLKFGKTQNNHLVEDVLLPKWAKSGGNFISIMRSALESEFVSSNLNNWIDLVFGYKQRGEKALEADNLFHHLRYGFLAYDVPEEERQGEIDNIFEFGQIPIQLFFNEPHPKKRSKISINEVHRDSFTEENEYLKKISKLKNERLNIEKRYEKERRQKEREIEEIEMKLLEREKEFEEQTMEINETIKKKEAEFAAYISTLIEQNIKLKENFKNYDLNKDKVYHQWIESVKQKHDKEIEGLFKDRTNLYKSIKELESILVKNKNKEFNYNKHTEELKKIIDDKVKEEKSLKEELFKLQKIIRNLPPEQQIFLKKDEILNKNRLDKTTSGSLEKNDMNNLNIRKIIRELK